MPSTESILDKLANHAKVVPDKPCFIKLNQKLEAEDKYTYSGLYQKVAALSGQFESADGWVLLLFQNSFEFLPYFLATIKANRIPCCQEIPNSNYKMDKLVRKIERYGISRVLVQPDIFEKKWFQKLWEQVEEPYKSKFEPATSATAAIKDGIEAAPSADSDIAFVQFTSGTTSEAKALGITFENVSYAIESLSQRVGRTAQTISLNWLPHFHDLGLIDGLLTGIYWGSTTYLMESGHFVSNPLGWLQAIGRYKVTHSSAPNFAYDLCVSRFSHETIGTLDLSSIQSLLLGGEMVRLRTIQHFSEKFKPYGLNEQLLLPGYGMAETTLAVSCQSSNLMCNKYIVLEGNQVVSCGSVFEGTKAQIVDDQGKAVADGVIGNIQLSGKGVAKRFHNGEFINISTVVTGDIGFMTGQQLYLLGRVGDLMIKNGQNFALSEVEELVSMAHPTIHTSGVIALLNNKENHNENFDVIAEVKRGSCEPSDYNNIAQAIRLTLSRALGLFPDRVTLVSYWSIPRTSSGKKQKQLLRQQLQQSELLPLFQD